MLYVISTPIGNMGDLTFRAVDVLKNVDLILSEDTRETEKILRKHDITKSQISYRDENHNKIIDHVKEFLAKQGDVGIVSNSGTPTISDPGFKLVREVKALGIDVVPVPGPSAIIAALSVSGLPTDNFTFLGFLPKSSTQRKRILKEFGDLPSTLVIYESPYRIKKLIFEVKETLGNRTACLAKDLTKKFERIITAPVEQIIDKEKLDSAKGEYVLLIAKEGFEL